MKKSLKAKTQGTSSPRYMSPQEAEIATGISMWTWRRKAYSGEIESLKVGTGKHCRLYIPVTEIDRVIAEGTRPRTSQGPKEGGER